MPSFAIQTRNGKIARLPQVIREQLNRRLDDGEPGEGLLEWLNTLPAVQAVLAAEFGGSRINAQNLSNWRKGGYQHWQKQQERRANVRQLTEDAKELTEDARRRRDKSSFVRRARGGTYGIHPRLAGDPHRPGGTVRADAGISQHPGTRASAG
jgi:hypothetical protein